MTTWFQDLQVNELLMINSESGWSKASGIITAVVVTVMAALIVVANVKKKVPAVVTAIVASPVIVGMATILAVGGIIVAIID